MCLGKKLSDKFLRQYKAKGKKVKTYEWETAKLGKEPVGTEPVHAPGMGLQS